MTRDEFLARDAQLRHAIQTGVAYEMQHGDPSTAPKHLRTGLDCSMCEHSALAHLLIAKGLITEQEFFDASIKALEEEVARAEARISIRYGANITLG